MESMNIQYIVKFTDIKKTEGADYLETLFQ